jgi:phage terminase small subunit
MLRAALEAMDRADQAREVVEREGMTTTTKTTGAVHVHPLLKIEREARHQFTNLWCSLGFNREANQGDR